MFRQVAKHGARQLCQMNNSAFAAGTVVGNRSASMNINIDRNVTVPTTRQFSASSSGTKDDYLCGEWHECRKGSLRHCYRLQYHTWCCVIYLYIVTEFQNATLLNARASSLEPGIAWFDVIRQIDNPENSSWWKFIRISKPQENIRKWSIIWSGGTQSKIWWRSRGVQSSLSMFSRGRGLVGNMEMVLIWSNVIYCMV